jgi:chromosome segregation ATPase
MLIMQILVVLGLGLVIYAVFGVFASGKPSAAQKKNIPSSPLSEEDSGKEQKIQRLQSQVAKLENQIEQAKAASTEVKFGSTAVKEKEAEFSAELKRREEWVAKAEAELAKIKAENLDLNNRFMDKEKELQEEFTKNVNLNRQLREIKEALEAKEMACRLKEDQLQTQKHQIENQQKGIDEQLAKITEFNRKEKISEWVPKAEFNQLNAEYTKLENDLEASQERLKSFAAEIAHLRQEKKDLSPEKIKEPEAVAEEIGPPADNLDSLPEESKAIEKIRIVDENLEKPKEADGQQ